MTTNSTDDDQRTSASDRRLSTAVTASNWSPTRISTVLVVVATLAMVALLAASLGVSVQKGLLASSLGAVCFAAVLWLLTWDRWRVPAVFAASILAVPAGAAITAGLAYVLLVEFAASFPAANATRVVGHTLRILSLTMVACGGTMAIFGATAAVRNVATESTLAEGTRIVSTTAIVPVGFALALIVHALVENLGDAVTEVLTGTIDGAVTAVTNWVFALPESPPRIRLLSFWIVGLLAVYTVSRALTALPLDELVRGRTVGDIDAEVVLGFVEQSCRRLVLVGLLGLPVAFLVGLAVPASTIRAVLPGSVYAALASLTSSSGLRYVFVAATLIATGFLAGTKLLRTSVTVDFRTLFVGYAPFLGGLTIVATILLVHQVVLRELVSFVAGRLSPQLAGDFRDISWRVVEFYGEHTIVLALVAGVLVLTVAALAILWVLFALRFVTDRVAGVSMASGGLFVAAAFAGTVGTSISVVLVGVVVSLLVWDVGENGVTLGTELGRRTSTRRVELLHVIGALGIGVLAALLTSGLVTFVTAPAHGSAEILSVALPGAVGAIVLLVMALR